MHITIQSYFVEKQYGKEKSLFLSFFLFSYEKDTLYFVNNKMYNDDNSHANKDISLTHTHPHTHTDKNR